MVTVLARAADRHDDISDMITRVFEAGSDKLRVTGALLAAYLPDPRVLIQPLLDTLAFVRSVEMLTAAAVEIPSSHRVSKLKVATASEALSRYHKLPDRSLTTEVNLLDALASGLFYARRYDEATKTLSKTVKLYSQLAKQEPERYTPHLVNTMINYGDQLVKAGEAKQGLELTKQVITLADVCREDKHTLLSRAFDLRSRALKLLEKPRGDARPAERAVQEARTAAKVNDYAAAWLPMQVMNLANRYSELGEYQQALHTIQEAVTELREREVSHPDPLSPNVSKVLINYAECLRDCGMTQQARQIIAESVDRLQRLAASYPEFRTELHTAMEQWVSYLSPLPADDDQIRTEYEHVIGLLAEISANDKSLKTLHSQVMIKLGTKLLRTGDSERGRQWLAKGEQLWRKLLYPPT